jgi:hypothetical protein
VFFPPESPGRPEAPTAAYAAARLLCAGCPVAEPCALAGAREIYGMWGGLTSGERKRRRRRAA